jgi:hypothetical protein
LADDTWHGFGEVPCLGPEDISPDQMAATISELLGSEVTYQQISGPEFHERLLGRGYSAAMADATVAWFEAKNQGLDEGVPRTEESTTPLTFRRWCGRILVPRVKA